MKHILAAGTAVAIAGFALPATAGETLDAIKARGILHCGVSTGLAGFSNPDSEGKWSGLDVDVCRALAAAVIGDADKVQYTPLTAQQRFTALQSGEVDILSRNTTWTLTRDTSLGLNFAGVTFYDGQGFMVPKALGVSSALELDGAAVCVQPGTTTELNLSDFF
ncbi:MAG: transporter substrate-binding domain-containing protein, partial [Inquilinus sp.]|nr:transporter substrate-binding domain-containing protein [Inquilinus sp.]